MKLLAKLERSAQFWFLLGASVIFSLLRLPSFFEPYWYGDEGVYEVLGFGMRHGRLLYQGIWDNKPPLLYLIYALFDGNQPYVKFFSFIVGLIAVYFFFALAKRLFATKGPIYLATSAFVLLLGLPFLEGNIANAENFMVLPTVVSAYLIIKTMQEKKNIPRNLFLAGLFLGVSFLIKVVAVFDFVSFFLVFGFVFFAWNKKELQTLFFHLVSFSIAFFLPLLVTVGFFAYKGMLITFVQSAFFSNVGYVNYGNQFFLPFTKIAIPQGFLLIKLLVVFCILAIVFWKRKSLSLLQLLAYTWLPFSVLNALFSGRPWTHYMLVLLGSICLLLGMILEKKYRFVYAAVFVVVCIFLAKNFWFYSKTTGYYTNFVKYVKGSETTEQYQSFFDKGVPRDYAIAEFLNMNLASNQNVFMWTNSAQDYYLIHRLPLGRYTVAYHITANAATLEETGAALRSEDPEFVVVLPNAPSFPFPMSDYRLKEDIQGGLIYERLF